MAEATEAGAVLLAAHALSLGLNASDEAVSRIAERLIELAANPVRYEEPERGVFGAVNQLQDQHDGPAWRFLQALAKLPPRGAVKVIQARALDTQPENERRLILHTLTVAASCRFEHRNPNDLETVMLQELLDLPAPRKDPAPVQRSRRFLALNTTPRLTSGHIEAVTVAIEMLGLTRGQAESAILLAGGGSLKQSRRLTAALRAAGFSELADEKGPFSGLRNLFITMDSVPDEDDEITFILKEAAGAIDGDDRRTGEPSWRLAGAAAVLELLAVGEQHIGSVEWAVRNQPDLVRELVTFTTRSEGLDRAAVAADARSAAELLAAAPLDGAVLLLLPRDPRRAVQPALPTATASELPWLRECVKSVSEWLNILGANLILSMPEIDGNALLLDEIEKSNPPFRRRLAAVLLRKASDEDLRMRWLTHDDQLVRAAAVGELTKRDPGGTDLDHLATDNDLTIRFALLRGLVSEPDARFEHVAGLVASDPPVIWTCTTCGSPQDMAGEDCKACTGGSRSEISDELRRLRRERSPASTKAP